MSDSGGNALRLGKIVAIVAAIGVGIYVVENMQQRSAEEARHAASTVVPRKTAKEFPAWITAQTSKMFNESGTFVDVKDGIGGSFSTPKSAPYSVSCDSGQVRVDIGAHHVVVYAPGLFDSPDDRVHPESPAAAKIAAVACQQTKDRLEEVFSP